MTTTLVKSNAMELGEKGSAEAKEWALRIELANKLRELERIEA